MKEIKFDELEDLRDDMDDLMFETNEINDMLGDTYALDMNEADLGKQNFFKCRISIFTRGSLSLLYLFSGCVKQKKTISESAHRYN